MNSQTLSYTELRRIRDLARIASLKKDTLVPRLTLLIKEMENTEHPECRIVVEEKS